MDALTRFIEACYRRPVDRPPVWLMRQAGRYMDSYQAVRARVSFMELCRSPDLVCEVTLMPIEQLGVDAAIIFSDILVPLEPMGTKVHFDGKGPHVEPAVRSVADIDRLRGAAEGVAEDVSFVYDAIATTRRALDPAIPLLGFSGAPWTLASYLVEGGTSRHHHELKRLIYSEPAALERLLDKLTGVVIAYLRRQVEAGAQALQVFDTWGGLLDAERWQRWSRPYTQRVFQGLADLDVPLVHYVNGGAHLIEAMDGLACDVLSMDWRVPLGEVRARTGSRYALQGNIDSAVMRAPLPGIEREVIRCLDAYGPGPGHIVNFGHGITPDAAVEAARALVEAAEALGAAYGGATP